MNLYDMQKIINWFKATAVTTASSDIRNIINVTDTIISECRGGFYTVNLEDYHHAIHGAVQLQHTVQIEMYQPADDIYECTVSPHLSIDEYVGIVSNDGVMLEDNSHDYVMASAVQVLSLLDCLEVAYVFDGYGDLDIIDTGDYVTEIGLLLELVELQNYINSRSTVHGFETSNANLQKVLNKLPDPNHVTLSLELQ